MSRLPSTARWTNESEVAFQTELEFVVDRKHQEDKLRMELNEARTQARDMRTKYQALVNELDDQHTIRKCREKEVDRLTKRLNAIETFQSIAPERYEQFLFSHQSLQASFEGLQHELEGICRKCVEKADFLPAWMYH